MSQQVIDELRNIIVFQASQLRSSAQAVNEANALMSQLESHLAVAKQDNASLLERLAAAQSAVMPPADDSVSGT